MLPKISYPTLSIKIPPQNKEFSFRPMLVKEEKLLLMAKTSEDYADILGSIKQVVNNCSIDPTFDVDKLPLFALEYVFLRLRGASIGEQIKVSYRDYEDDEVYDFNVLLSKVEIKYTENAEPKIQITPKSGVIMKYPSATLYDDKEFLKTVGDDSFYKLIARSIDQIYDQDNVYEAKNFEQSDLDEFIELLDIQSFEKIKEFLNSVPTLYYKLEYTNKKGNKREIELTSLTDFFTLR
jgi:T4 bacteriophage base plate protein